MTAYKDQTLPLCLKMPVWKADTLSSLCQAGLCCSFRITPPVVEGRGLGSRSGQEAQKIYFQNIRGVEMLTGVRLSWKTEEKRGCNCPLRLQSPRDPVWVYVGGQNVLLGESEPHETTASTTPVPAQPQCVLTSSCLLHCSCLAGLEEGFQRARLLLISHLCCQGSH